MVEKIQSWNVLPSPGTIFPGIRDLIPKTATIIPISGWIEFSYFSLANSKTTVSILSPNLFGGTCIVTETSD